MGGRVITDQTRSVSRGASLRSKIAYGVGDVGFLAVWQGATLFLLYFYIEIAGLPPLLAGAIFLAGMVWDALTDPVFAAYAERSAARGRSYARQVVLAAPLVGLSYLVVFIAPAAPIWIIAGWALATHLAFRSAYTLASMPYNTLPARLSFNADERSRFTAARVAGAAVGGLAAAGLTPVIAAALGGGLAGYAAAAAGLGALAAACLVISGLGVRESPDVPPVSVGQEGYAGALAELWRFARRTGPLQRLLSIMVAATLGFSIFSGALMFQIQSRPGWAAITPLLLAAPSLASLAAALLWPVAAERSSKRAALAAGALLAGAGFIAFGFADAAAFALAALAVTGAGLAAIPVMLWSMAADAVDYGQLNTGARVEARVFGLFTFLQKIATGLGALIIAAGLAAAGGAAAGAPVAPGWIITGLVSAVPAGFMVLTAVIAAGYSIDRSAHAAIARTLSAGEEPPTR